VSVRPDPDRDDDAETTTPRRRRRDDRGAPGAAAARRGAQARRRRRMRFPSPPLRAHDPTHLDTAHPGVIYRGGEDKADAAAGG
jgi:hypothetical protein